MKIPKIVADKMIEWLLGAIVGGIMLCVMTYLGIENINLRETISDLWGMINKESIQRTEMENRAVRAAILNGALLIRNYRADQREIDRLTMGVDLARQSGKPENIKRSEQALADAKKRQELTYELYSWIMQRASDYSAQQYAKQLDAFKQRHELKPIGSFAELYTEQAIAYNNSHIIDKVKLGRQILEFQP